MRERHHLANREEFEAYASRVAAALGVNCRTEPYPGPRLPYLSVAIVDDEGRRLTLSQRRRDRSDQLTIRVSLPEDAPVREASIGVSALAPAHVAGAIRSRLYPLHETALRRTVELLELRRRQKEKHDETVTRLSGQLTGASSTPDSPRDGYTALVFRSRPTPDLNSIQVDVGPSGSTVRIDAHLPADQAEALLRGLSTHPQWEPETP